MKYIVVLLLIVSTFLIAEWSADTMKVPNVQGNVIVTDSFILPLWVAGQASARVGMMGADTANDSIFMYLPAGKTAIYPQASAGAMSGGDITDSLNNATRSITQIWEWDGGNIVAADGQKFIWTDDSEADSGSIYDAGDTTHITSDNPIRIGGAGVTKIMDSLVIPMYAAFPATGSEGLFGVDSAADSVIAYWGGARRVIYPNAASQPSCVTWQGMWNDDVYITANNGANTNTYFAFDGNHYADSVIIDSLKTVMYTSVNDVYIDSVCILRGVSLTAVTTTAVWGDGTNLGEGNTNVLATTYTPNLTCGAFDRPSFWFSVATASEAGEGRLYNVVIFCHYQ